jgi:hypothetical protein
MILELGLVESLPDQPEADARPREPGGGVCRMDALAATPSEIFS